MVSELSNLFLSPKKLRRKVSLPAKRPITNIAANIDIGMRNCSKTEYLVSIQQHYFLRS
jgi:hypothetical protein